MTNSAGAASGAPLPSNLRGTRAAIFHILREGAAVQAKKTPPPAASAAVKHKPDMPVRTAPLVKPAPVPQVPQVSRAKTTASPPALAPVVAPVPAPGRYVPKAPVRPSASPGLRRTAITPDPMPEPLPRPQPQPAANHAAAPGTAPPTFFEEDHFEFLSVQARSLALQREITQRRRAQMLGTKTAR